MKLLKLTLLASVLLLICTCEANAQEPLPVVGGKAVLTIIPDTVLVTDTVTLPPIVLPPDTIIVIDTVFVTDTLEVCPVGWTCEPPPEPEGPYWARSSTNVFPQADTLILGEAAVGERIYLWLDMEADTAIIRIYNYVGGIAESYEQVWPYALRGDGGNPRRLYGWVVGDGLNGPTDVMAIVRYRDTSVKYDTIIGVIEIVNPSVPPDTLPPIPPDTVPPVPEDTLAFFDIPAAVVSWGARDSTGEAIIAWGPIDGTRIRYSMLVNVSIPEFYLGDDDETWFNIPGGVTTTRTASEPPASPMAVCVMVSETAEVGRGPGGYYLVNPPEDSTTIPIAEIVCRQYSSLTDNLYAFYASPWHDYYLQPGDTIQDGGYSIGLIKADGGPIVADSVLLFVDGAPHTLLYEPRYGASWGYNGGLSMNYGSVTLGYIVFGGLLPDSGDLPLLVSDHNGGSVNWPDSAFLSTPANLRVIPYPYDTMRHVIAWDEIPEDSQCENDFGTPVNCRDVYGDEVYYRVTNVEPPLHFTTYTAMASTMRSFPWAYPGDGEILPDTISFCVTAEAWDCPNCEGPGGSVELPGEDEFHRTRSWPISETACITTGVR